MKKWIVEACLVLIVLLTACSQGTPARTEQQPQTSTNVLTGSASIDLPASSFRLTNAEGETLVYDSEGLRGDLKVLSEYSIINGSDYPSLLKLTVNASAYFVYENLLEGYTSFSVHCAGGYGDIRGDGLKKITIDAINGTISAEGENISYRAWLKIDVRDYEYFFIKGENANAFTISKTQDGVATQGLNGVQMGGFADRKTMTPRITELNFTNRDAFDLSQTAETGTILFTSNGTSNAELVIDVSVLEKE